MKKISFFLLGILLTGLANFSCSDKGEFFSGIQDGEELAEGASVPFFLHQNYPNPFNPSTAIQYQVSTETHIRLKVFTDDWQEVQMLINRRVPVGHHLILFNAGDLPSGEYYYMMESQGITQIRKMKLAK